MVLNTAYAADCILCFSLTKGLRSKRTDFTFLILAVHQSFYILICISTQDTTLMFLSDEGPTFAETLDLALYGGSTTIFFHISICQHWLRSTLYLHIYTQTDNIYTHRQTLYIHTDRHYIYTQTDTIYTHRQTRTHTQIGIRSSRAYAKRGIFEVHAESFHFRTLCRNFNEFFFLVTCHANTAIQSEIKKATKYHSYSAITESHLIRCLCRIIMCFDTIGGLWINSGTCQTAFCWLGC